MPPDGPRWSALCGLAVQLCGGQAAFRAEANILKRLVQCYGPQEVEVLLGGARLLGWRSMKGLAGPEGIGRRWAQAAWWAKENQNPHARQQVESLGAVFKARGLL